MLENDTQHLIDLIEKRKKIGKTPKGETQGERRIFRNSIVEYNRLGGLIVEEVVKLFDEGKLKLI